MKKLNGDKMENKNRLVVADIGWAETIPDWLKKEVEAERLSSGFASVMDKGNDLVGEAEVCIYLYTLSLKQCMGSEYTQIYIYLVSKLMKRKNNNVPKSIEVKTLTEYEYGLLKDLKRELYIKRGGEIKSPLFDIMRKLKRGIKKNDTKR